MSFCVFLLVLCFVSAVFSLHLISVFSLCEKSLIRCKDFQVVYITDLNYIKTTCPPQALHGLLEIIRVFYDASVLFLRKFLTFKWTFCGIYVNVDHLLYDRYKMAVNTEYGGEYGGGYIVRWWVWWSVIYYYASSV